MASNSRKHSSYLYFQLTTLGLLILASAALAILGMAGNQTVMAQDAPCSSTFYELELFEGAQFSDRVVGLDQEVRAAVLEGTLIGLTIETDKDTYVSGDTITISGEALNASEGEPILIRVFNPDGELARVDQVAVSSEGTYSYAFVSGGPLMSIGGEYMVEANCGNVGVGMFFTFLTDGEASLAQTSTLNEDTITFTWINPGGDAVRNTTVPFSSSREDTFAPNEPGNWTVQAEIVLGDVTIQTLSTPLSVQFFVLPESPVGAVAMVAASMGALGGFLYIRSRNSRVGS